MKHSHPFTELGNALLLGSIVPTDMQYLTMTRSNEQTPLLYRGGASSQPQWNNTPQVRRVELFVESLSGESIREEETIICSQAFEHTGSTVPVLTPPCLLYIQHENDDKRDRRSHAQQAISAFSQKLSSLSLLFSPPLNDTHKYEDAHNDESWTCSFGTREDDGIWINSSDRVGILMASLVWILFFYSCLTILLLAHHGHCPIVVAAIYCTICALALASHIKTSLTDPGSVPSGALPLQTNLKFHTMCSICQTYKPDCAHHCRICNRCISRMDHHCKLECACVLLF